MIFFLKFTFVTIKKSLLKYNKINKKSSETKKMYKIKYNIFLYTNFFYIKKITIEIHTQMLVLIKKCKWFIIYIFMSFWLIVWINYRNQINILIKKLKLWNFIFCLKCWLYVSVSCSFSKIRSIFSTEIGFSLANF